MDVIYLIAYAATAVAFFGLDFFGLTYLIRPVFERDIGNMLLDQPKYGPAAVFYLFYVAGVVWFVVAPALTDGKPTYWVFLQAALLGALAYGTYEFTNLATLRGWTWRMVATDLTWGTLLTGVSATGGYLAARAFTATP